MSDFSGKSPLAVSTPPGGRGTAGEGAATASAPAVRPRRRGGADWRKRLEIGILSGPAILLFLAFVIFPVVMAAYYGFYRWKGFGRPTDFVGLKNYVTILQESLFHEALWHNFLILVLSLVLQGPVAVAFALLLNQRMHGQSIIR